MIGDGYVLVMDLKKSAPALIRAPGRLKEQEELLLLLGSLLSSLLLSSCLLCCLLLSCHLFLHY